MKKYEITAKSSKVEGREPTIQWDGPETVSEAVEMYGEEVVFNKFLAAVKIDLQSAIRRGLEKGFTDADIAANLAGWRPQTGRGGGGFDAEAAFLAKYRAADKEEKKRLLALLKGE